MRACKVVPLPGIPKSELPVDCCRHDLPVLIDELAKIFVGMPVFRMPNKTCKGVPEPGTSPLLRQPARLVYVEATTLEELKNTLTMPDNKSPDA